MTQPRPATPTVTFIDEYCQLYQDLFPDVRSFEHFKQVVKKWVYHINWQNDLEYVAEVPSITYYAAFENGVVTGASAIHPAGNIHFLMVDKAHRGMGIGTKLLQAAATDFQLTKMSTAFPNNSLLEGFYKKQGFIKAELAQYEMYMPI